VLAKTDVPSTSGFRGGTPPAAAVRAGRRGPPRELSAIP
jgi:hypothetical protein